jgi:hypothetical protein
MWRTPYQGSDPLPSDSGSSSSYSAPEPAAEPEYERGKVYDGGESDNNYGFGDVIADESAPDTGDYDYEWSSGHRACGDDDN